MLMAVAVPGVTKMRIWRTGSQECELIIAPELRSQSLDHSQPQLHHLHHGPRLVTTGHFGLRPRGFETSSFELKRLWKRRENETIKLSSPMIHIIITITQQCIWKLYGFFVVDNNNNNNIKVRLLGRWTYRCRTGLKRLEKENKSATRTQNNQQRQ